jgi:hypothetical protein
MRKDHALHNEKLCDELYKGGVYTDWVVTTAFYSALNFVKHQIFPLKIPSGTYNEFEDYYHRIEKKGVDKHTSLQGLVCRNLKGCSGAYRWLLEASKLSRYNNYQVTSDKAKKAYELLSAIKKACPKP